MRARSFPRTPFRLVVSLLSLAACADFEVDTPSLPDDASAMDSDDTPPTGDRSRSDAGERPGESAATSGGGGTSDGEPDSARQPMPADEVCRGREGEAVCEGEGRVLECDDEGRVADMRDCPEPGECEETTCEAGACGTVTARAGTPCRDGYCDARGACKKCLKDAHCPDPGECMQAHCDLATGTCEPRPEALDEPCSTGSCDGTGRCTGCVEASECGDPGTCHAKACNQGACEPVPASEGMCTGSFGSGFCAEGECVQCRTKADCGEDPDCQHWTCDAGSCALEDAEGVSCQGSTGLSGECRGGACVECLEDADCGPSGECSERRCSSSGSCSIEVDRPDGTECRPSGGGSGACSAGRCEVARRYHGRVCLDNSPTGGSVVNAETGHTIAVEVKFCGDTRFTRVGSRPLATLSDCHAFLWDDAPSDGVQAVRVSINGDDMAWIDKLSVYDDSGREVFVAGVENGWGWCFSQFPDDGDSSFCREPDDDTASTEFATPSHTWNVGGC